MSARDLDEDSAYFTRRAREERERAAVCEDYAAAIAHLKLADEYARKADAIVAMPVLTSG